MYMFYVTDSKRFYDWSTSSSNKNVYLFNIAEDPTEHFEVRSGCVD